MQVTRKPAPWQLAGEQGSGRGTAAVLNRQEHYSLTQPVALAVKKPGRGTSGDGWVVVGAITWFTNGEGPILRTTWRSQRGTTAAISMPTVVLDYARRARVKRFYLRDDRRHQAWACSLDLFDRGRLQVDGERYIPLSWLSPCQWREWPYAERVIKLENPKPEPVAEQLPLLEVAP